MTATTETRTEIEVREWKDAAEHFYAAAMMEKKAGNGSKAREHANEAINLYKRINVQTLDDAIAVNFRIGGILIPELMHEDVVEYNLAL